MSGRTFYMQQRYYDPIAARFLSLDPVVTDGNTGKAFGRYHYANNNPYRYTDPTGAEPYDKCWWTAGCETLGEVSVRAGQAADAVSETVSTVGKRVNYWLSTSWSAAEADGWGGALQKTVAGFFPGEGAMFGLALKLESVAAKSEGFIYKAASGTPSSMTPRIVDSKGLSATDSLANALPGKNQIIDTSKLRNLCFVCDNALTGHVSITPKDMSQMQGWINSRGGAEIHPLTRELMDAVVGTVKK